jgi:ribosomal protein S18 acetylase RimI-like enzyme
MDEGNKTALRRCRFLNEDYFPKLYAAFIEAFSDYVIPFALTEAQFRNHIILNAVDLDRTVGCEEGDELIGFSLNGFGLWNGKLTAYDAGTGVIPSHRRRGISREMFDMMMPVFTESGIEQFLLEVVTMNKSAIALYENLGFRTVRELALLQRDQRLTVGVRRPGHIDIRDIREPDWNEITSFWDGEPSWQNSIEAVERSRANKRILGAYADDQCVGYIVFSSTFGRVAQLAVEKGHRQRGVGTALVLAMQNEMAEGFSMQVINIDKGATSAIEFFKRLGFYERLSQYEMVKPMSG